jgi:hypothetical protein
MTCIAAVTDGATVYMASDRALSDKESIIILKRPKIALNNGWLIGYAGSLGIGQLFHMLDIPAPEGMPPRLCGRT